MFLSPKFCYNGRDTHDRVLGYAEVYPDHVVSVAVAVPALVPESRVQSINRRPPYR